MLAPQNHLFPSPAVARHRLLAVSLPSGRARLHRLETPSEHSPMEAQFPDPPHDAKLMQDLYSPPPERGGPSPATGQQQLWAGSIPLVCLLSDQTLVPL